MTIASQGAGVAISAVRYPPCACGLPYGRHAPDGCAGYRPVRPVEWLGTRAYRPPGGWPLWRRLIAATLWSVEFRAQRWRERL